MPEHDLQHLLHNCGAEGLSQLVQDLLVIMPERTPGDHLRHETLIIQGGKDFLPSFRLLTYIVANFNIGDHLSYMFPSDEGLLRLLQDAAVPNEWLRQLRASKDPYSLCLFEAFFASAVRKADVAAVTRLLQAGASPMQLVDISSMSLHSHISKFRFHEELVIDTASRSRQVWWMMPAVYVALGMGDCQLASSLLPKGISGGLSTGGTFANRNPLKLLIPASRTLRNVAGLGCVLRNLYDFITSYHPASLELNNLYEVLWSSMRFERAGRTSASIPAANMLWDEIKIRGQAGEYALSQRALVAAILMQDTAAVQELVDGGVTLRSVEQSLGWSPLGILLGKFSGYHEEMVIEAIKQMHDLGADLNPASKLLPQSGVLTSLIFHGIENGSTSITKALLKNGTDPANGLNHAFQICKLEIVAALLEWGVKPGYNDIIQAIGNDWSSLACQILQLNAEIIDEDELPCQINNYCEETPLSVAIDGRRTLISERILNQYPTLYDCRALSSATYHCWMDAGDDPRIVDMILKRRAIRPHKSCIYEGTALALALARADEGIIRRLDSHGINTRTAIGAHSIDYIPKECYMDPDLSAFWRRKKTRLDSNERTSLLSWAAMGGSKKIVQQMLRDGIPADGAALRSASTANQTEIFDILLKAGADLNDWSGRYSCLADACRNRDASKVRHLLALGANVDESQGVTRNTLRQTALQTAVETRDVEIIEILLSEGGVNVNEPAGLDGATALQYAAVQGDLAIAKRLLDLGADPNQPGRHWLHESGMALEEAAEQGRLEVVNLLLDSGVRSVGPYLVVYIYAISLATENGHTAIANILRRRKQPQWTEEDEALLTSKSLEEKRDIWDDQIRKEWEASEDDGVDILDDHEIGYYSSDAEY